MLDDRILSPVYFFGLYSIILVVSLFCNRGRIQNALILACMLVWLTLSVVKFKKETAILHLDGQGFFSEKWRDLPGIKSVRNTNKSLIYTDEPLAIYILTGKVAYQVPYTRD